MQTIMDYANSFGNTRFTTRGFQALDALVFSQLAYLPLEITGADKTSLPLSRVKVLLKDVQPQMPVEFMLRYQLEMLATIGDSRRFGALPLFDFVDVIEAENNLQFSATTFVLPGPLTVVAFRGTDLSLAGWQEDFHITFDSPVLAQRRAVDYLQHAAEKNPGHIMVCGHSKGGNLAVYAAAFCGEDIQDRIKRVFSFDAPGQTQGVLNTKEYQAIRKRIRTYLPQRTLVGVMLNQTRPYTVVACDAFGIHQHNPFHWQVEGGAFKKRKTLSAQSQFLDKTINGWIAAMSKEERKQLTQAVFTVLEAPGADGFDELSEGFMTNLKTMWGAAGLLPAAQKQLFRRAARLLVGGMVEVAAQDVKALATGVGQGLLQRFRSLVDGLRDEQEEDGVPDEPMDEKAPVVTKAEPV